MKAISLKQPWASFIALGRKTIETRTWKTDYRGKLLIVSSKSFDTDSSIFSSSLEFRKYYPLGQALAIVNLINCRPMRKEDEKLAMSPYHPGLYSWVFSDIQKTEACKRLKRNFVSIEINPEYCKIAEERLAQGVL